ncbi:MAG TPA: pitrilysin family protein [Bacteroidia bacterium]|nr:pitrilysin family protein [Bacteroidia bacterium]
MITALDRHKAPALQKAGKLNVIHADKHVLDNGVPLYVVNAGVQDVVRFEIIFPNSVRTTSAYMHALSAHHLLDSGTAAKDALAVARGFDNYGAHFESEINADWKTLSLFSLSRLLPETLPLLHELITEASFPDNELDAWKTRNIQQVKVQKGKVSWLARKAFNETLYGSGSLYGFTPAEDDFSNVDRNTITRSFASGYDLSEAILVLSGKFSDKVIADINRIFGSVSLSSDNPSQNGTDFSSTAQVPEKKKIEKADAVQSCIRIGKLLFTKNHPDYQPMTVVSTLLGGYFGSRLMANIREDKGYTYGIGCALSPHRHGGHFFITTETGKAVCADAVREIYSELDRLSTEPVPADELELVKSYMSGAFQRNIDGPFALADRFKSLILHGLDYQYLEEYQDLLLSIQPATITGLAQKWLAPDTMTEIIAG